MTFGEEMLQAMKEAGPRAPRFGWNYKQIQDVRQMEREEVLQLVRGKLDYAGFAALRDEGPEGFARYYRELSGLRDPKPPIEPAPEHFGEHLFLAMKQEGRGVALVPEEELPEFMTMDRGQVVELLREKTKTNDPLGGFEYRFHQALKTGTPEEIACEVVMAIEQAELAEANKLPLVLQVLFFAMGTGFGS